MDNLGKRDARKNATVFVRGLFFRRALSFIYKTMTTTGFPVSMAWVCGGGVRWVYISDWGRGDAWGVITAYKMDCWSDFNWGCHCQLEHVVEETRKNHSLDEIGVRPKKRFS